MTAEKLLVIAEAQRAGLIPDDVTPLDVLTVLNQLASGWLSSAEFHDLSETKDPDALAKHRVGAVAMASRLFPSGNNDG